MFNNYIYYSDEPLLSQEFCDKLIAKFNTDKNVHQGVCGHKDEIGRASCRERV